MSEFKRSIEIFALKRALWACSCKPRNH